MLFASPLLESVASGSDESTEPGESSADGSVGSVESVVLSAGSVASVEVVSSVDASVESEPSSLSGEGSLSVEFVAESIAVELPVSAEPRSGSPFADASVPEEGSALSVEVAAESVAVELSASALEAEIFSPVAKLED